MMRVRISCAAIVCAAVVAVLVLITGGSNRASASFPGENGLIAYQRDAFGTDVLPLNCDIHVVDPDTGETSSLPPTPECEVAPAWSADGTKIAVAKNARLWVMDANGQNGRFVDTTGVSVFDPAWSPDGTMIAFHSSDGAGLYIVSVDGGVPFRVAHAGGYALDGGPSWSPDCNRIAFANGPGLSLVNPDGSGLEQLTSSGNAPSWSPDCRFIAFNGFVELNPRISVVDVETREQPTMLTSTYSDSPSWSPDGTQIAFRMIPDPDFPVPNIYAMNSNGSDVRQLTNHSQGALWLDWQPLPEGNDPVTCEFTVPEPSPTPDGVGGLEQQPTATGSPAALPVTGGEPASRGWNGLWLMMAVVGVPAVALLAASFVRRGQRD